MIWPLLIAVAVLAAVVFFVLRARGEGAAPGPGGHASAAPAGNKPIPPGWGWAKVHLKSAGLKALGYYYKDRMAGPSFKILVDLASPLDDAAIRDAAREKQYRAESTFRLGAHETINVEPVPPDFAAMLRQKYESGTSPAGPQCAVVLFLTTDERRALDLPERLPGIDVYL